MTRSDGLPPHEAASRARPRGASRRPGWPLATGARVDRGADAAGPRLAVPRDAARGAPSPNRRRPQRRPPRPRPRPRRRAAGCQQDEDCPDGNICQSNVCQPIELRDQRPALLPRGAFTEVFLFYWSRAGTPATRWCFRSTGTSTRRRRDPFVAPFYWHFEDSVARSELTVIVPFSRSHEPGARRSAIWPLFYASNKFGWAVPLLLPFTSATRRSAAVRRLPASTGGSGRRARRDRPRLFPLYVSTRTPRTPSPGRLPLNFYWRNADDANLLALPLFYKNRHNTGNAVYTWLGYSRREGRESSGSAFWLYWYGRDDASHERYDVLFPLLWSFRSPEVERPPSCRRCFTSGGRPPASPPCSRLVWAGAQRRRRRAAGSCSSRFYFSAPATTAAPSLADPARRRQPRRRPAGVPLGDLPDAAHLLAARRRSTSSRATCSSTGATAI